LAEALKIMVDSKIENTSLTLFLIDVYFTPTNQSFGLVGKMSKLSVN
jgi:hypothetical protein